MVTITYNLRADDSNSDRFYNNLSTFTDTVIERSDNDLKLIVNDFLLWQNNRDSKDIRTVQEYYFELLSLGVFWREYNGYAGALASVPRSILQTLVRNRNKNASIKPWIDKVRGVLGTITLLPEKAMPMHPDLENFECFLGWLAATGEFNEEVKRLDRWRSYFATLPCEQTTDILLAVIGFAAWFDLVSEDALGEFTPEVESFRENCHPSYKWREDYVLSGRRRVEYHLSLLGSEILNRAFKANFYDTTHKLAILPGCMRYLPEEKCRAHKNGMDETCTGCSPKCAINRVTRLGHEQGFETRIVSHASSFTAWLKANAVGRDIGIIGVACAMQLVFGGLKLKGLNIPAQCVFLDYCGCNNHWHQDGNPTDLNDSKLLDILHLSSSDAEMRTVQHVAAY